MVSKSQSISGQIASRRPQRLGHKFICRFDEEFLQIGFAALIKGHTRRVRSKDDLDLLRNSDRFYELTHVQPRRMAIITTMFRIAVWHNFISKGTLF